MPLSTVTVTGGTFGWITPDNLVPVGQVVFQPVQPLTGGGYILAASSVTAPLVAGNISKVIANNTQLAALQYIVTEQVTGVSNPPPYVITPTGAALDLSTAPRGALGVLTPLYVQTSALGVAGGVPTLDGTGKVPLAQLPTTATGVLDVAAADATIVVTGAAQHPTVGVGAIPESKVTNLTTDLAAINTTAAGKATKPIVRRAYVTTGTTGGDTPPDTAAAWAAYAPIPGLAVPAVAGDLITLNLSVLFATSTSTFWDIAVKNGAGTLVWFGSNGTTAPPAEGDPALSNPSTSISPRGYTAWLDVAAAHVVAGSVTFVMAVKSNATGKIYYSTAYPFRWIATNYGAVS
jgi:hypothetical protein